MFCYVISTVCFGETRHVSLKQSRSILTIYIRLFFAGYLPCTCSLSGQLVVFLTRRMITRSHIALMHHPGAIGFGEFRLHTNTVNNDSHTETVGIESYNTVPQGPVVPQNNILLLMRMRVDVPGLQHWPHDPSRHISAPNSLPRVRNNLLVHE